MKKNLTSKFTLFLIILLNVTVTLTMHVLNFSPKAQAQETATFTIFRAPNVLVSGISKLTADSDGNVWFVDSRSISIGKITPSGNITEYQLPYNYYNQGRPQDITLGPDGNLWFIESGDNTDKIGKITTNGDITEYQLSTSGKYPRGITRGSDGNLWFTFDNGIGKLSLDGTVHEYPLPTSNIAPYDITDGPDGNLWFSFGNTIGKITTNGDITEYQLPTGGNAWRIITGPDGNLWFVELNAGKIGKITTSGVITEYPINGSAAYDITAGPDGNLWVAYNHGIACTITKITPNGVVTEYPLSNLSCTFPEGITTSPDGNIWFTDANIEGKLGGKLIRVNLNGSTPTPTPTATPTPILPQPFLDLPWNYEQKGLTFNEAALEINSYFDHEYPFLCCGILYSLDLPVIKMYENKETDKGYSSHDGYDYGRSALVEDGDPVLAAASGIAALTTEANSEGGGNVIKIDHGNGYQTIYEHLYYDESLVVKNETDKVNVQKGQQIGRVGHNGNCWVPDQYGNRIYRTPACAHIHFGVVQDKEFIKDQNYTTSFSDNIPDGLTDPYGWQPSKNENEKDDDPWEKLAFTYQGKEHKGNKSYYLWIKKLPGAKDAVTSAGGTYTAGEVSVKVEPNTFDNPVTLEMHYAPSDKVLDSIWSIGPVINITAKDILGDFVTLLTKPVKLIWQPFKDADLSRFKPGTFYLYSSKDGDNWTKEQEVDPFSPGNITATASHFTYFAIMGERKDITPPVTSTELQGAKGIENWFRDEVSLTLTATDSADEDPAGIKNTYYKINDEDWSLYKESLSFKDEGHYRISFYSDDYDGNIEDLKTVEFDIDKTPPAVSANTDRIPDKNYWYNHPVTITFTGQDSGSGITKCADPIIYNEPDNAEAVVEGSCTDKAGNIGYASIHLKYDSTKPKLTASAYSKGAPYTPGSWTNGEVQVAFTCTDETSEVNTVSEPITISSEGKDQSVKGNCEDNAGNKREATFTGINIDKTKPLVSIKATPDIIWPPNGKMVDVLISGNIVEENLKNKTFQVIDEYGAVQPPPNGFDTTVKLEAKRNGNDKDGREYIIKAIAQDQAGNTGEAVATVVVPHDQSK